MIQQTASLLTANCGDQERNSERWLLDFTEWLKLDAGLPTTQVSRWMDLACNLCRSEMKVPSIVDAAEAGQLSTCAFHLAVENWRQKHDRRKLNFGGKKGDTCTDAHGRSPLLAACAKGHLHVAQFLMGHRGCEDVGISEEFSGVWFHRKAGSSDAWLLQPSASGATPLSVAGEGGHLETVKWLLDTAANCTATAAVSTAGGDGVAPTTVFERMLGSVDAYGFSTLALAAANGHTEVVQILLLHGAANRSVGSSAGDGGDGEGTTAVTFGHVDPNIISDDVFDFEAGCSAALIQSLRALLTQHQAFTSVLCAVYEREDPDALSARPESRILKKRRPCSSLHRNPLPLLRGHEATLLQLICEFAGVANGRQLRNAREALEILVHVAGRSAEFDEDSGGEWPF